MDDPRYEVKNEEIKKILKDWGRNLKDLMPKGWGFMLMMFDYNTDSGSMFYMSSAQREDMIKAMKEFIEKDKQRN